MDNYDLKSYFSHVDDHKIQPLVDALPIKKQVKAAQKVNQDFIDNAIERVEERQRQILIDSEDLAETQILKDTYFREPDLKPENFPSPLVTQNKETLRFENSEPNKRKIRCPQNPVGY